MEFLLAAWLTEPKSAHQTQEYWDSQTQDHPKDPRPLCSPACFYPFRNCLDQKHRRPSQSDSYLLRTYVTGRNDELVIKIITLTFPTLSGRTRYVVGTQQISFCSPCQCCQPRWLGYLLSGFILPVHHSAASARTTTSRLNADGLKGREVRSDNVQVRAEVCASSVVFSDWALTILMLKDSSVSLILSVFRIQNSQSVWKTSQSSCRLLPLHLYIYSSQPFLG